MTHNNQCIQEFRAEFKKKFGYEPELIDAHSQMLLYFYKAGRAAERAEIREKLESEGLVETIATALINGLRFHKGCTTSVTGTHAMLEDDAESYKAEAKAAITKILEVIC